MSDSEDDTQAFVTIGNLSNSEVDVQLLVGGGARTRALKQESLLTLEMPLGAVLRLEHEGQLLHRRTATPGCGEYVQLAVYNSTLDELGCGVHEVQMDDDPPVGQAGWPVWWGLLGVGTLLLAVAWRWK
jgi:hypothetical protein